MKLVQLNMWGGRLSANVAELLKKHSPDFVCLQEVFSSAKDIGLLIGTLQKLQEELNYPFEFYSPVFEMKVMNSMTQFGNCVLSRQPLEKAETIFTNLKFVSNFNFDEHDYNVRNLQHVVVKANGKKLNILNHHGHHIPSHKRGDAETLRQMKLIGKYIDSLSGPVILTGDFNLAPDSESIEQINNRLDNQSTSYRLKTTRTPLTHKTEVCDYIFTSNEVKVVNFEALDEIASDHKALILEFDL